jgi:hypothetical protein
VGTTVQPIQGSMRVMWMLVNEITGRLSKPSGHQLT